MSLYLVNPELVSVEDRDLLHDSLTCRPLPLTCHTGSPTVAAVTTSANIDRSLTGLLLVIVIVSVSPGSHGGNSKCHIYRGGDTRLHSARTTHMMAL